MQVELTASLLEDQHTESLLILAICAFGTVGRHRIVPDVRATWDAWAATLPVTLSDELQLVWDDGESKSSLGPSSLEVQVRDTTDLTTEPILVTPPIALTLLGQPLRILLENGRNDRAFVVAFADASSKKVIVSAERAGWLVFDTAGGIGELRVRLASALKELASKEPASKEPPNLAAQAGALRTMYLCDSDAREVAQPSTDAKFVQGKLDELSKIFERHLKPGRLLGWVLKRRAAENYAPHSHVLAWAKAAYGADAWRLFQESKKQPSRDALRNDTGKPDSARRQLLAAIALGELDDPTRSVMCMKHGRGKPPKAGEAPNWRTPDAVWNTLDPFQAAALSDGFGDKFSESFYGDADALPDMSGEVTTFIKNILERL